MESKCVSSGRRKKAGEKWREAKISREDEEKEKEEDEQEVA